MKLQITILLLIFSLVVAGQKHPIKDRYPINDSNDSSFYQKAQSLIQYNNPDSSWEATRILWALIFFDTTKYSMELYQPLLDKIETANRTFYEATLAGQWNFEWSGTNWGTAETSKEVTKRIIFNDKEAIFYSGNKVKRKTGYYLSNEYSNSRFVTANFFRLVFTDNKEEWTIRFYNNHKFVPYIGNTNTIGMLANQMPNCSCGCPEEIYSKVIDDAIVIRKD